MIHSAERHTWWLVVCMWVTDCMLCWMPYVMTGRVYVKLKWMCWVVSDWFDARVEECDHWGGVTETSCITITPLFSTTSLASLSVKVLPPLVCNLYVLFLDKLYYLIVRFVAFLYLCVIVCPFHILSCCRWSTKYGSAHLSEMILAACIVYV